MKILSWPKTLFLILGVSSTAAIFACFLPDNPYQRWQLVENTIYSNATWSYERIHFDARAIDIAIIGPSRTQHGLSAPAIESRLAALKQPLNVANFSVLAQGRNLQWAIAEELFKNKTPRLLVLSVAETPYPWGHPGFRYVAPKSAILTARALFLHNAKDDVPYLPFRQMMLFAASVMPISSDLRSKFDPVIYAAKPDDYSVNRVLADGRRMDMGRDVAASELRAQRRQFAATQHLSHWPNWIGRVIDDDDHFYVDAITHLAAEHGTRVLFIFLPEFEGATTIADRAFYAARGSIVDVGDLAQNHHLFMDFAHLNHRGALIASDRVAAAISISASSPGPRGHAEAVVG